MAWTSPGVEMAFVVSCFRILSLVTEVSDFSHRARRERVSVYKNQRVLVSLCTGTLGRDDEILCRNLFVAAQIINERPIQTGIQRKLNFVSVRTIKGSSPGTQARAQTHTQTHTQVCPHASTHAFKTCIQVCFECMHIHQSSIKNTDVLNACTPTIGFISCFWIKYE